MARAFVKMPTPAEANEFAMTIFSNRGASAVRYQSKTAPEVLTIDLPAEDLEALAAGGASVFPDIEFEPFGPVRGSTQADPGNPTLENQPLAAQIGLNEVLDQIRAVPAWEISRGMNVTIVVVDTGICGSLTEFPLFKRSPIDLPTAYAGNHWNDTRGHGSMCATIAAATKAGGGRFDGVAPDATVLSARTTLMASDIYRIYDEIAALKLSGGLPGPVVFSNSYGLYTCAPPVGLPADHPYLDVVLQAVQLNMPVVFAAGNNHWDVLCGNPPASCSPNTIWAVNSHDDVLSVGTVNRNESNRDPSTPHPNSSRGPGQWALATTKPDCVAPTYGEVVWGCGYQTIPWWGTSGACPQVAGLAALILGKNPSLASGDVYDIIRASCRPIAGSPTCVGRGMIDCKAALDMTP
jgi:serine protease AprX